MKKTISILLVLAMVLGLCACVGDNTANTENVKTTTEPPKTQVSETKIN